MCSLTGVLTSPGFCGRFTHMRYSVMLERLPAEEGMPGYYYAHVPSLGLTTHGLGIEGALDAARDLVVLWNEERRSHGEVIPAPAEAILATMEVV